MHDRHRFLLRLLLAAAIAACASSGARAQDDLEPEEDAPAPGPAVIQPPQPARFVVHDAQFDQWAFGGFGGQPNAAAVRARLDSLLTLMIEDVDRTCGLSDAQRAKLRLAGRGDLKRFFDRVEEKRRKFQDRTQNPRAGNDINAVFQEIRPLQAKLQVGLFGDGSLFAKTIRTILDPKQVAAYEAAVRDKRRFRYRARVESVATMLGNAAGMSTDQRRRFAAVLLEETRPPLSYGQQDYYAVLLQASRVPEAKLRPIFDDAQWRLLRLQLLRARSMEPSLKVNGYIPDDAPADRDAKRDAEARPGADRARGVP